MTINFSYLQNALKDCSFQKTERPKQFFTYVVRLDKSHPPFLYFDEIIKKITIIFAGCVYYKGKILSSNYFLQLSSNLKKFIFSIEDPSILQRLKISTSHIVYFNYVTLRQAYALSKDSWNKLRVYTEDTHVIYALLHYRMQDWIASFIQQEKIDKCSCLELGCGFGYALERICKGVEKGGATLTFALGCDQSLENIKKAEKERDRSFQFIQENSIHCEEILNKKFPQDNSHRLAILSGALNRLVLENVAEAIKIMHGLYRGKVDTIIATGATELLVNTYMIKRLGFTTDYQTHTVLDGNYNIILMRRKNEHEVLQKIINDLRKNPHHLDLKLCPCPQYVLQNIPEEYVLLIATIDLTAAYEDDLSSLLPRFGCVRIISQDLSDEVALCHSERFLHRFFE